MKKYNDLDRTLDRYIDLLSKQIIEIDKISSEGNEVRQEQSQLSDAMVVEEETVVIPKRQHSRTFRWMINVLFYGGLVTFLTIVVFSVQSKKGAKISFLGYYPLYIETSSMESVMPRGSMIFIKEIDPQALIVGDDITYIIDNNGKTVTHRIINISPDFEGEGLAFETKGVDNATPDKEKVLAANVLGKVTLVLPSFGIYLTYIKDNVFLVVVFIGLCSSAVYMFRQYLRIDSKKEEEDEA